MSKRPMSWKVTEDAEDLIYDLIQEEIRCVRTMLDDPEEFDLDEEILPEYKDRLDLLNSIEY